MAIAEHGGCLQCHLGRTGTPDFRVVDWPDGLGQNREEPACGAHFQPYGPVELSFENAMVSDMALDSADWRSEFGTKDGEGRVVDRHWSESGCAACHRALPDK